MSSIMRQQRSEFMDFLGAIATFDDLPLLAVDQGDIQNDYERALGTVIVGESGALGVVAMFATVIAPSDRASDDSARVMKFIHRVGIFENVIVNRDSSPGSKGTQVTYEEWIERLVRNTTGIFQPTVANSPFILDAAGAEEVTGKFAVGADSVLDLPGKMVKFFCYGGLGAPDMPTVAVPTIVNADGEITLATATPGAAIFYTLDGSRPRPGKTLYTAPFATPAAGTLIQARAYLTGYLQPNPSRTGIAALQL